MNFKTYLRQNNNSGLLLWDALIIFLLLFFGARGLKQWDEALMEPTFVTNQMATDMWKTYRVNGELKRAFKVTSTSPHYGPVILTGYDAEDNVIWAVHNLTHFERVR